MGVVNNNNYILEISHSEFLYTSIIFQIYKTNIVCKSFQIPKSSFDKLLAVKAVLLSSSRQR